MYLTGTDGAAYSPYSYDPFGNRIDPRTGKPNKNTDTRTGYTVDGNIIQPFAFTGYREEESGHYYAQARSYDPRSGRFTGEDKVRGIVTLPDSINHYLYCLNDPTVYVDQNGLWPKILEDIGNGIAEFGKGVADSTVGVVKQAIDDPGKFAAAAVTGLVVGAATAAVAAACVAAAPCALAAFAIGTVAYGVAGAVTLASADMVGQTYSKYYDPKKGINTDEVKTAALAGWTFGSMFGGGAAGITKSAGKAALTLGEKVFLAGSAGWASGTISDYYAQTKDPNVEKPSIWHAMGVGTGMGFTAAFTTYGVGKFQETMNSKVTCGAENGSGIPEEAKNYDNSEIAKTTDFVESISPDLKTDPDTAYFWSGKTDGVGGADVAARIAKSRGGVTLESTIESKNITMPEWDFNDPSSMDTWDMTFAAYAEQVSGEVHAVVGADLRPGNIWENVELPRLKNNPNVTKIITIDPKTGTETVIFER